VKAHLGTDDQRRRLQQRLVHIRVGRELTRDGLAVYRRVDSVESSPAWVGRHDVSHEIVALSDPVETRKVNEWNGDLS